MESGCNQSKLLILIYIHLYSKYLNNKKENYTLFTLEIYLIVLSFYAFIVKLFIKNNLRFNCLIFICLKYNKQVYCVDVTKQIAFLAILAPNHCCFNISLIFNKQIQRIVLHALKYEQLINTLWKKICFNREF